MRKALQAEQSKAEMLIKITNIEEECNDLEEIVDDLKKRINRMLKDEEKEK
jgi:tetrahydromethanopterin S-methyltransferase subunit B